jgi:hypothetical protein
MRKLLLALTFLVFLPMIAHAQVIVPVDGSKFYCPANSPGGSNCCTKITFDSTTYTGDTRPFTGMECAQGQYFFVKFPDVGVSNARNFPAFNITARDGSNSSNVVFQLSESINTDSTTSGSNPFTSSFPSPQNCLYTIATASTLAFNHSGLFSGSPSTPSRGTGCASGQCWVYAKITRTDGSINCQSQTDGYDGHVIVVDGVFNFH